MPSITSQFKLFERGLSLVMREKCLKKFLSGKQVNSYENSIQKLNELQTNASVLRACRSRGKASHVELVENIEATEKYLSRTGITLEKLDNLSIIHVSGTKGKGSTCALCESILREHGYKTGLFTSPHLISVQERIRLNGVPLSQQLFVSYFEKIYNDLVSKKEHDTDMPAYFKFLTVMALNVFLKESVDVAIIEVGIGGAYDCTNLIRNPTVVGITSLGLDHTSLLGDTLEEIAWQKAGIMKNNSVAFTVPQQTSSALYVLREKAAKKQCKLQLAPPLSSYTWDSQHTILNTMDHVQSLNLSLALQLSNEWMKLQSPFIEREELAEYDDTQTDEIDEVVEVAKSFKITEKMVKGVRNCSWPGRTQILCRGNVTYFLDGAHTVESINYCTNWFDKSSNQLTDNNDVHKIAIFNTTGDRDAQELLKILNKIKFNTLIFTPNFAETDTSIDSDSVNYNITYKDQFVRCKQHDKMWRQLEQSGDTESQVVSCMSEALRKVVELSADKNIKYHVLLTGSLHLVGCALSLLDPLLQETVTHVPTDLKPLENIYKGIQASL